MSPWVPPETFPFYQIIVRVGFKMQLFGNFDVCPWRKTLAKRNAKDWCSLVPQPLPLSNKTFQWANWLWGTAASRLDDSFLFFPALMDVGLWVPFGLCIWAELLLNHLGCGWAANPQLKDFSCTEHGITKFVRARAGMDSFLSNWLHLEWLHASLCSTDAFFEGV